MDDVLWTVCPVGGSQLGDYAGTMLELLVQRAGEMSMCRLEFLPPVAQIAKAQDTLVIYEEVMTGFGRTGALFTCLKAGQCRI
ncbi:MAG: aminotransferase class III-fold pyridoxal phosphate-dependent enzyme [Cyanobacteria bacterium P01_H01_bin.15]